ncbi:MAG: transporter [Rickettsiaceae bacterium]|jgi:MHS family proline/betaine transporter-like MFS transporter|nr:transporter [Rickettsiaceae bacterium]
MRKVVISGMIGNALEWYDYALYAQFAAIIGQHFFPPSEDPLVPIIATFGVFAAGFIMRPVGAVVFGRIGDKYGRRIALSIAILMMAIPTALIGLLPSYETIGLAAPICLTLIRLLQGMSLGGEFSGCIAYIVEHAPIEKRGLAGSSSFVSMCAGMLLGSLTATFMSNIMDEKNLIAWGWRIPFVAGLLIGAIGLHIRLHLSESPVYLKAKEDGMLSEKPLREIFTNYRKELLIAMGLYLTVTVPFYTLTVFVNNFMQTQLAHPVADSLLINTISLSIMIVLMPFSSMISDRVGRKPILIIGTLAILFFAYPVFWLLAKPGFTLPLISQIIFATVVAIYMGPVPTSLVELFPTRVRFTGVALSYNISAAVFGGTAPMVAFWLIKTTENNHAMAYYIIFFSAFTMFTLKYFTETYRKGLTE